MPELAEGQLTIDLIQDWLERRGNIQTIDEVVDALPRFLFSNSNHVFMRFSASECADEVTPANPRLILFDANSRLILAFMQSSETECGNSIRIIQGVARWGEYVDSERYIFASLVVRDNRIVLDRSVDSCVRCHTLPADEKTLLPIWAAHKTATDTYLDEEWPGAFGGAGGSIIEGNIQGTVRRDFSEFQEFLKKNHGHGRFARFGTDYLNLPRGFSNFKWPPGNRSGNPAKLKAYHVPNLNAFFRLDHIVNPKARFDGAPKTFINPVTDAEGEFNPIWQRNSR